MSNAPCANKPSSYLIAIWNEHDRVVAFVKDMRGRSFNSVDEISCSGNYLFRSELESRKMEGGTYLVTLSFPDQVRTHTFEICSKHPISDFEALKMAIASDTRTCNLNYLCAVGFERLTKPYDSQYKVVDTSTKKVLEVV